MIPIYSYKVSKSIQTKLGKYVRLISIGKFITLRISCDENGIYQTGNLFKLTTALEMEIIFCHSLSSVHYNRRKHLGEQEITPL